MKKRVLKMFVMCLVICLTCSCLSLVANAEVKSDIKEVKMLAKSGDKGKESCQIEIWFNPNLNAVQDLNLEITKNEVQNLIKINGFTIKQIVDFNNTNKCLQTHKWERQIIYIWNELYGVKGYLPCEKHDTIDNCNCDKNTLKPIMAYDDTDTLEYLKGFMLDGIQPLEENIMYGFKKDIWWRDGTVLPVTDGWINASSEVIEGEGPSEFLDYNKNPKLNFDSQIMTKGKAKYYSAINGETGFNIRLAHLSAKGFLVNLLTKDGEGIKIKYYTENWSNYKIETTYCYKNNEGIATENSEILSFADGWHWYAN